jgi:hypothetical protein
LTGGAPSALRAKLTKAFTPIAGGEAQATIELLTEGGVIQVLANQHELVFGLTFPLIVVEGKAFATEMKNVPLGAFLKPEDAFGAEDIFR